MKMNVAYLTENQIEKEALALLVRYRHELGKPIPIPIPADEILETHLGLTLDFDDLEKILGFRDVLGALWVDKREVFIDQSLDPEEHPWVKGRFNFSIGHEIGHWVLHRQYLEKIIRQKIMFPDYDQKPAVICRMSKSKDRIEWQADYFSSCLLMPRESVLTAWSDHFGNSKPIVYADIQEQNIILQPSRGGMQPIGKVLDNIFEPHNVAFDRVAKIFAPKFAVSIQAMKIRLENMGLLLVDQPAEMDLF